MKHSLSIIVTTHNEADNIARCLNSISTISNDVMVVDSFSTDETVAIAEECGAKVVQRAYQGPADQKNWAIPQAKNEWVLLLDADEVASPELVAEITTLLNQDNPPASEVYWISRNNHFLGQPVRYSGWQGDKVVRFFLRDKARYTNLQVHEEIITDGLKVGYLTGRLDHYTFRNLDHYLDKTRRYARWSAQDHASSTAKVGYYELLLKPLFRFFKHFVIQQGFRDGKVGFIVSAIMAWGVFLRYAYIRAERQQKQ